MDISSFFSDIDKIPFSFVYNGNQSTDLLKNWECSGSSECDIKGRLVSAMILKDPDTNLEVICEFIEYDDYPATEWVVYFRNSGASDTPIIENIRALDIEFDIVGDAILHHSKGSTCAPDDFLPIDDLLVPESKISLAPNYGRSSDGVLPFVNLEWQGEGLICAVGWTGQWMFEASRSEQNVTLISGQQNTRMLLHPGEVIRTPRMLLLNWVGNDRVIGHNLFRKLILEHYTPTINCKPVLPKISMNTWFTFDTGNGVNEKNQLNAIKQISKLGVENYWLDAGWFEGGWPDGAGNWTPRSDGFPKGLSPLGEAAKKRDMGFVLWFEPERVTPNSLIAKEHPEWVLHIGDGDTSPCGQDLKQNELFNLGNNEARMWLTDMLADRMIESGVTVYRQDFNIFGVSEFWKSNDSADRVGVTENLHIQGLYAMWDELLDRVPGLSIDNCASGGRRIDLEMISRSYPLWQSDTQCCGRAMPIQDQVQNAGLNLYVPLHSAGVWDFDPYIWRSTATTGINLCMDLRDKKFKKSQIKKRISELKILRDLYISDYYPLTSINGDAEKWLVMQFNDSNNNKGMVVCFRRDQSRYTAFQADLKGIVPKATYKIKYLDGKRSKKISGKDLTKIMIKINKAPGSSILLYEKI